MAIIQTLLITLVIFSVLVMGYAVIAGSGAAKTEPQHAKQVNSKIFMGGCPGWG